MPASWRTARDQDRSPPKSLRPEDVFPETCTVMSCQSQGKLRKHELSLLKLLPINSPPELRTRPRRDGNAIC